MKFFIQLGDRAKAAARYVLHFIKEVSSIIDYAFEKMHTSDAPNIGA